MATSTTILLLLGFLAIQSQLVSSLLCHTCTSSSQHNSNCGNLAPSYCPDFKVCAKYILQTPNSEVVHRACTPSNICNILETRYGHNPAVSVKECHVCSQDGCNS